MQREVKEKRKWARWCSHLEEKEKDWEKEKYEQNEKAIVGFRNFITFTKQKKNKKKQKMFLLDFPFSFD